MRRLPSLIALRAFEAAARLQSFAVAAAELGKTPSAVSHQVRALEDWIGRPLFHRRVRRVVLTDEGWQLLGKLGTAFDLLEEACAALRPREGRETLSVHCAPSFAAKWLGPRLPDFMEGHPDLTLELTSSAEPLDLALERSVHLAITYGMPRRRRGVMMESLGAELTLPLCSPRLLTGRRIEKPEGLIALPLIESKINPVTWADWCRLNDVAPPKRVGPAFDRGALAVAAAVDGLGIALETTRFAEAELASGQLVALDGPAFRRIERETHVLCYREAERGSRRVVAFRDWLRARLKLQGPADAARPADPGSGGVTALGRRPQARRGAR